ncbi:MAG: hypothetical protein GY733_03025 [bacterium]|nr:hypothetical protein [bacterium]
MHPHQYRLKVSKPDAKIRLSFAPNTLHRLPGDLIEKDYRVDLLALGAAVRGTLQLEGMSEPVPVEGWATLTHTISARSETDMALRRIEILSQKGENPLYVADFLDPAGGHSSWLGYLDPGCDTVIAPSEPSQEEQNRGALVQEPSEASDKPCLRILRSRTAFDLASRGAIHPPSKRGGQTSYWIPPALTLEGQGVGGRVLLKERFLRHDPLGDLPGPIRFLARLSTKPRRVWSPAQFEVTIVPSLNSKPILFQGQGVAAVSFLNPVTRP